MTAAVVEFPKGAANASVVSELEDLLVMARSGELQAVAVAGLLSDGSSRTLSSGTAESRGLVTFQALLGAVMILQHRLIALRPSE